MEDEHLVCTALKGFPGWAVYAVFDGHAGKAAAIFSRQHFVRFLLPELKGLALDAETGEPASAIAVEKCFKDAFWKLDAELATEGPETGGTTCTAVLVTGSTYYFANLGDSRTIMTRSGKVGYQTRDHKPYNTKERLRIKNAGGFVLNGRVDGGLAVSRAFGDFIYKQRPDLGQGDQKVSPTPQVDPLKRVHAEDLFLLLACDGVWDVMSSDAVSKFAYQRLKKADKRSEAGIKATCKQLVERCLQLGSRDNISVLIILFAPDKTAPPVASPIKSPAATGGDGGGEGAAADGRTGEEGSEETGESVQGVMAEAIAFNALERGLASAMGGGEERFTRRDTIVDLPDNFTPPDQGSVAALRE